MKALKKATALLLSLLMLFGSMSVMANAALNDGNRNSFAVTSWFLRYDEATGEWIETEKAARGDKVKVRLNLQTDFGAGAMDLLWEFTKKNLTFDITQYEASGNVYSDIHNEEAGSSTADYGYYGTINPIISDYETGNTFIDWLVEDGYITEEFTQENGFLMHGIAGNFVDSALIAQKLTSTEWMYEYYFTVADDATGEGKLFLEPSTIQGPDEQELAYFNITRAKTEGVSTVKQTNDMYKWESSYDVSNMGSITFDNTVTFTTDVEGATIDGTTEYTGYIGDAFSTIDGFAIPTASAEGKQFLGWSLDGTTVIAEDDLKAMTVDYEPVTLTAVFQAAEATYALNIYEMGTDGEYPEAATITYPGAATGTNIEYVEEMPADEDKAEGVTYVEYAKTGFSFDSAKTNTLTTTVIADGDDKTDDGDDIVIYLKRAQTNIAFNAEDGTAVDAADRYYESTYTAPAAPEKKGYTCTEWAGSDGSTLAVGAEATVGLTAVTYTPVYEAAANTATIVINYVDQVTGEAETKTQTVNTTTGYTVAIVEEYPETLDDNTTYVLYSELIGVDKNYEFDADNAANDLTATVDADGSTVLNVQYIPVQYTATFTGAETFTDDYYTEITVPAGPEVAGSDFTGWLGSDGSTVNAGDKIRLEANVTYTAQYTDSLYTVTYVFSDVAPEGVDVPVAVTGAKMNDTITLSDLSAEGYTFTGWTVTEGTGASYDEATKTLTVGTSNVTVTGNWIKNTYTINYYLDDAKTVLYASQDYAFGAEVKAPETPTTETDPALAAGTKFEDWGATLPTAIDTATAAKFTQTAEGAYSIDYIASISDIEYTITFYYMGLNEELTGYGNTTVVYSYPAYYGDTVYEADAPDPSDENGDYYVEGYTFDRWNPTLPQTVTKDITFRAYFTVNSYPITFDANGGSWLADGSTQQTVYVAYGSVITAPIQAPTRTGYTQDTDMPWDPELTSESILNDVTDIPTYKARWNPNPHTIKFTVEGATTETTQYYDKAITVPEALTAPTKDGYVFKGWSTDGATVLTDLGTVSGDAEFIAVFEPDENGVNYTVNRYFMNLDGNYDNVEPEVLTFTEVAGTEVTYTATVEGFTLDPDAEGSNLTETISGDGNTVINAYFSRNQITVDVNGAEDTYYYDEVIEDPGTPVDPNGGEFKGWKDEDGNPVEFPYTVPDETDKEITISPIYYYTVEYYSDNAVVLTVENEAGTTYTVPSAPAKVGYTFKSWTLDGADAGLTVGAEATIPAGGATYVAKWEGNEGVEYTVETYKMNSDGTTYAMTSETLTGKAGETATAATPDVEGFTYNAELSIITGEIAGDGSLVLEVYYDRNKITVDVNGAEDTYYYDEVIEEPETPVDPDGGEFEGWEDEDGNPVEFPYNVPDEEDGEITITPIYYYTVKFISDGSEILTVENRAGTAYTVPSASKTGYTFAGWTLDGADAGLTVGAEAAIPAGGATYVAAWTGNEGIAYTVETYKMNLDGTTYAMTSETLYGTAGETATAETPAIEGFTHNPNVEGTKLSGEIAGDGSLVLKVYYDRNKITVDVNGAEDTYYYDEVIEEPETPVDPDGGEFEGWEDEDGNPVEFPYNVPDEEDGEITITPIYYYTVKFISDGSEILTVENRAGTAYTVPSASKTGYTFAGWTLDGADAGLTAGAEATIPVGGATYVADLEANDDVSYTVKLYMMNTDGTTYKVETENYTGKTDETIIYEPGAKTGFTFDEDHANNKLTDTITADGNMTLRVYYDRNQYTVSIDNESDTYYFGEVIEAPAEPSEDGYTFDGWYSNGALVTFPYTVPASNVAITSKMTAINYPVVFMVNGTEYAKDEIAYETVISAPATPPEVAGYTFLGWSLTDGQTTEDAKVEFTADGPKVAIDGNTYYAILSPNSNIKYTVYKVYEKLEGGWGEPIAEERTGTAGELVTIDETAEAETGFGIYEITPASANIAGNGSTEFYIYYERNTVTVTINGESDTYLYQEPIADPGTPSKNGYTFTGWEDSEGNPVTFPITAPEKDLVIVPTWDAQSFSLSFTVDGTVVEGYPVTAEVDSTITAPADPKKEGWTFTGWYDANGKQFTGTMPAYDVVYAAEFVAGDHVKYTIRIYTMDTNGEYTNVNSTVAYGTTGANQTIVPETETMVGYTVDTDKSYLSGPIAADGSTVYTVYYARNLYEVTFDGSEAKKVYFGAAIETPADPVKNGYTFTGWQDADGNDVPATMPAKNLDFTSQWTTAEYTVTYVVNGVQTIETYAYGATVTIPVADEVTGMTFSCWNDGKTTYQAGDTFTMPAEDMIIVAQFTVAIYTVTFLDADGMTFATELVKFGETIPVPVDNPTKANYTFEGWNLGYTTMPAKDITVEPIFKRIPPVLVAKEGSTTVIDRNNMIIYGLEEFLDENLLRTTYLAVEGDGYFTVTPVDYGCYGTGTKVELYDNLDTSAPIETYIIVVFGDLNGDSVVQAIDSTYVNDEALGLTHWADEVVYDDDFNATPNADYDLYMTIAADVNRDGVVDSIDATIIADASIGIEVLDQVETPSIV